MGSQPSHNSTPPQPPGDAVGQAADHAHGHPRVHLHVVPAKAPRTSWRRVMVVVLTLCAVGAFGASLGFPWWKLQLYAPQYPRGLTLIISLTKIDGDVHEISTLNHYIGMASLADAAQLEKKIAVYAVAALGIITLALMLFSGRKFTRWLFVPGLLFPLGFLADSYYWMYKFGHNLDPKAPLTVEPFTPQLFGNGEIGQFMTFAVPQLGFVLAVTGLAFLVVAVLIRGSVCADCSRAGTCGSVCSTGFIGEPRQGNL